MTKTAVHEKEVLICDACNEMIEECHNCGKEFKDDDEIHCNDGYSHYCDDCKDCEG